MRSPAGIAGYALGRHGHDTDHIGPIVATETDTAIALAAASLSRIANRPASIDVPDDQHAFGRWLREQGFVLERPFTRMTRGTIEDAGHPVAGVRGGRAGVRIDAKRLTLRNDE